MTCADYHAWQGAIQFGAEMIVVCVFLAAFIYWDRRR